MSLLFHVVFTTACRGTHPRLALDALRHLRIADAEAWSLVEAPRPFREVRHAELSQRLAVANFAAERS